MRAEIKLEDEEKGLNLLHSLYALTKSYSHEGNQIAFYSGDDEFIFFVRTSVNYISFGKASVPEPSRMWTENIPFSEISRLFGLFLRRRYDDLHEAIRVFNEP